MFPLEVELQRTETINEFGDTIVTEVKTIKVSMYGEKVYTNNGGMYFDNPNITFLTREKVKTGDILDNMEVTSVQPCRDVFGNFYFYEVGVKNG